MELLLQIFKAQPWFPVVTAVVTAASAVAAITPTPKPGSRWSKVYKIIDFAALNVGRAKDTGIAPIVKK
jgi:hypothetical protein